MSKLLDQTYAFGPDQFGSGTYGCVWEAKDRSSVQFAIKEIDKAKLVDDKELDHLEQEIQYQYCLRHDGLVKLERVYVTPSSYFLVMEPVVGERLLDIIAGRKYADPEANVELTDGPPMPEDTARMYFQQLVDAILYMHRQKVAHRDLKLENIIITADKKLKVCDFGLAVEFRDEDTEEHMRTTFCGTYRYMAPEIFMGEEYSAQKADVWAMGVILYTMCTGRYPFNSTNLSHLKQQITRDEPEYPDYFSPELTDFLRNMLKKQPQERPDMEAVATYRWLGQWERCLGDEPLIWDNENLRQVDEPVDGMLTPLTLFGLIGAIHPLRLEPAACDGCQDLKPVTFIWNLSDLAVRKAIREWVEEYYAGDADLQSSPQSMELRIESEESGTLAFTITTCELSGVRTLITMQLHAGNPRDMQDLKGSLVEYLDANMQRYLIGDPPPIPTLPTEP